MESMYIYAFGRQLNQIKEQLDQQNTKLNSCARSTCQEVNHQPEQGTCCTRKPVATKL